MSSVEKNLSLFRSLLKNYVKSLGKTLKNLAGESGLGYTTLSNKLNETDGAKLNEADVNRILLVLIEWEAITTQSEVLELLTTAGFGLVGQALNWKNPPFATLKADVKPELSRLPRISELNELVGRQVELAQIGQLLQTADIKLLSLTGGGGMGKTRLARQVFNQNKNRFEIAVWLELASLTDYKLVPDTLGRALGLKETSIQTVTDSIKIYLQDKATLLVLDNLEQIIEASVFLTDILRATRQLKIIVTSREALNVYGECLYSVKPLAVPDLTQIPAPADLADLAQLPSLALFVARAKAVKPDFELTQDNLYPVAEICNRLDGIPLALELAAARLRAFTPSKLLERLNLKLLSGGSKDLPARHQTLTSTLDWSYELLTSDEQALFCRLAIFGDGCSLEAAEIVCAGLDVFTGIESLISKSLLIHSETASGESRYSMLQTVREYGLAKLEAQAQLNQVKEKYIAYYLDWLGHKVTTLGTNQQVELFKQIDVEYNNLQTNLAELILSANAPKALRLCIALGEYWQLRGYWGAGSRYLEQVLQLSGGTEREMALCFIRLGCIKYLQSDPITAGEKLEKGLQLARSVNDKVNIAFALNVLGTIAAYKGNYSEAQAYCEESLAIREELHDLNGAAATLNNLGVIVQEQGNYPAAEKYYLKSLAIKQKIDDKHGISASYNNLGNIAYKQGNNSEAENYYLKSLAIKQKIGDKYGVGVALNHLGNMAYERGNYSEAQEYYLESLLIIRTVGNKSSTVYCLNTLGNLAFAQDNYQQAREYYEQALEIARQVLDKRSISFTLSNLATLNGKQDNYLQAQEFFYESLQLAQDIADPTLQVTTIISIIYFLVNSHTAAATLKLAGSWRGIVTQWLLINKIKLATPANIYYEQCNQLLQEKLGSDYEQEQEQEPVFVSKEPKFIEQLVKEILNYLQSNPARKCS